MRNEIKVWRFNGTFTKTQAEAFAIKRISLEKAPDQLHLFPEHITFFMPSQSTLVSELNRNADLFSTWSLAFGSI